MTNHNDFGGPVTLVLLDPTSIDGESALSLLSPADDHVALITMVRGRTSTALRDFAHAEDIDVASAAWVYLDQVVARTGAARTAVARTELARTELDGRALETMLVDGPDFSTELVDIARLTPIRRVLVGSSLERLAPAACQRLRAAMPAPVIVAAQPSVAKY